MQEVHWSFINPYIWTIAMYSYVAKGVGGNPVYWNKLEEPEQVYFSDYVIYTSLAMSNHMT